MKNLGTISILLIGLMAMYGCMAQPTGNFEKVTWIIGTWESKTPKGSIYESWKRINPNELSGRSYVLNEKDTITFETISLLQLQNKLFYTPTVSNQNEGLPIQFGLKSIADTTFTFENTAHDFPQIITYTLVKYDSLVAEISGKVDGQVRRQRFPMKKIK